LRTRCSQTEHGEILPKSFELIDSGREGLSRNFANPCLLGVNADVIPLRRHATEKINARLALSRTKDVIMKTNLVNLACCHLGLALATAAVGAAVTKGQARPESGLENRLVLLYAQDVAARLDSDFE
jgi:hypothetical protein